MIRLLTQEPYLHDHASRSEVAQCCKSESIACRPTGPSRGQLIPLERPRTRLSLLEVESLRRVWASPGRSRRICGPLPIGDLPVLINVAVHRGSCGDDETCPAFTTIDTDPDGDYVQ